ncbi:hypothetical protein scyTo_0013380 [Scyliorhinus torazame]|uniref:Uncharacterized protein n=1 Tax=Scyliorhinus torazame TaxID=75743 RepID=A0A401NV63_SCYTO|nr:hypothetical protein [Scyliorhinus torazame]
MSYHSCAVVSEQRVHTGEQLFPCQLAQECSSTGGRFPYSKELTELEGFMSKLFDLSNSTITNGGSDMGMSEDTQVSMDTSNGGGFTAVSEIPERADEEGTEVNTSQQCGMAAAVGEGEECQEDKMSDLEGSVDELKLNIVTCVKEEACDDLAAVMEGGCSEPSGETMKFFSIIYKETMRFFLSIFKETMRFFRIIDKETMKFFNSIYKERMRFFSSKMKFFVSFGEEAMKL